MQIELTQKVDQCLRASLELVAVHRNSHQIKLKIWLVGCVRYTVVSEMHNYTVGKGRSGGQGYSKKWW